MNTKPTIKPENIQFCSGPCKKRPGWSFDNFNKSILGRSHRSIEGINLINQVIDQTRKVAEIPNDYLVGIVPGSATGAIEMAMWNFLGPRPVDFITFDVFGNRWYQDVVHNLKLNDVHNHDAQFGELPDLTQIKPKHDVLFTWNGTTTGVRVPDAKWISDNHEGLIICDATSAAFGMELPWSKLDVTIFSWQKCLGGEAGCGVIVLSPKAIARLQEYTPSWPVPWLLSLKNNEMINYGVFEGKTINTPSMMVVADALDALNWIESIGGLKESIRKTNENFSVIDKWVADKDWIDFDAKDPVTRSTTSVCLQLTDNEFNKLNVSEKWGKINHICCMLKNENVALDIKNHALSRPGFRIWCGPTVESGDISALLPWLEWAYKEG